MDEFQINGAGDEEVIGDEFYEKIEAPKFVDLAAPDRCRTENDDRYWFCLRVGCDQKHEEEMDPEEIYKNFVLRVMAARSPSVGLRKALCRRDSRLKLECPRTVPAKSSKSRVSRLAMISSISTKMGEAKVKVKQSSTTPNVKKATAAKQPSTKALTTPRNKKGVSNPGTFRSVRNPKPTTVEVPKDRVVAKALVFHSPKKAVKLKKSVEWSSSLRRICSGMKKLEITDGSKKNALGCNKPLAAPRKQLRGREVKSRVYDSLHCQNQKTQEVKSINRLKKKKNENELPLSEAALGRQQDEQDTIDSTSKNPSDILEQATGPSRSSHEENIEPCPKDNEIPEATEGDDDKENAMASNIRVSESKVMEIDNNKENYAASDENRKLDCDTGKLMNETHKNIQKVAKVISKTMKENSTAVKGAQGMNYRKPKLTNPKPFRLRTDERGILKEANLEKKHLQAPEGDNESDTRTHKDQTQTIKTSSLMKPKGSMERKISTIPQKRTAPMHQKATQKSEGGSEKTRPRVVAALSRKKLGAIKEMSPTMARPLKGTSDPNKNGTSLTKKASSSQRRRHTTIPKEPNFHSLHAPKNCTKRVVA
ncbi:hypothetical protein ERO13_D02G234300v2 [Gossypium hirsutum]|uniref:Uncharacterized protein n=3 Tax=Gossypium TaxID=3633 RepID=A0A1U8JLX2_GOSHI|nr:uncharacterized protein LOC107908580 [Gossypium hirsutum]KAG4160386.1 hypothetical protein ERO13_D02G234300v2 [Gossypium hirsutum]TYH85727.1 hypothetical protein ES332_D02G289200v1 [Gossypium tomentosum]TYI95366.1 hypothetical protein E1A91_D02G274800v1 [Gossypium mustelinum]